MSSKEPNLTALKRYLKARSKEELTGEISELFKKIPAVKDYYQVKLDPQAEGQVAEKYQKIIQDEFFPARGFGKARLAVARKAVNDYKKIAVSPASVADIRLFYVEQGVKFTNAYGDIDEPFYNSMEGMYEKAIGMDCETSTRPCLSTTLQAHCGRHLRYWLGIPRCPSRDV